MLNVILLGPTCSLPLCSQLLTLAGQFVVSVTDTSQLAQETVVQWGLIMWLTCALDVFKKQFDSKVSSCDSKLQLAFFLCVQDGLC